MVTGALQESIIDYEPCCKHHFRIFHNVGNTFLRALDRLKTNPEDEIVKVALI